MLPEDIDDSGVLGGCEFQRKIEQAAYSIAGGGVPVSTVGAFVFGEKAEFTRVKPTVKPKPVVSDFGGIFPEFVLSGLKNGIMLFDRKIKGFADKSAVLTAPETRSSSPIRIVRNEELCSISCRGVTRGEGSGICQRNNVRPRRTGLKLPKNNRKQQQVTKWIY